VTLRTRLNLVVAALSAVFVALSLAAEMRSARSAVREEIEGSHRVAALLLGHIAGIYSSVGGPNLVLQFLEQLGRVRANEVYLLAGTGAELYRSPPATYKAGREAPAWFVHLLSPAVSRQEFRLRGGVVLIVQAQPSRALLDAWDEVVRFTGIAVLAILAVNTLALWSFAGALAPFPVIAAGLGRIQRGELTHRLPEFGGYEANAIGAAFNRMAAAVESNARAERQVRDAEARLEERREMAYLTDQRVEEERRLIAHELHDEFGQSVTAIRSLAMAIVSQAAVRDPAIAEIARLISAEAARLYDAMHGLIPRLAPVSLDATGLAATLESLVADWQRRHPATALSLQQALPADLGPSVTLVIYRLVQEGLINALRHARAAHIAIEVATDRDGIAVSVTDDGIGLPADWARPGHFGLRGLADRVGKIGGSFVIGVHPPRGTRLRAQLPLGPDAAPAQAGAGHSPAGSGA
jgi:two-component system sensor histidine kinase UhpB